MTEQEARQKWCPFSQSRQAPAGGIEYINLKCIASDCMAWRWEDVEFDLPEPPLPSELEGYCGLANG